MELLMTTVKDLVIVGMIASFCDILLPRSEEKGPVRFIFGLYFLTLFLSPVLALATSDDFSGLDFSALGAEAVAGVSESVAEEDIYDRAAEEIAGDISAQLDAIYKDGTFSVKVNMTRDGFSAVSIDAVGSFSVQPEVLIAEIKDYLQQNYGMDRNLVKVQVKQGEGK